MKKTVLWTLFIAVSLIANAQLTELHTFQSSTGYVGWGSSYDIPSTYNYGGKNSSGVYTYYMYNWNFSLYKTFTITPPSGYNVSTVSMLSKQYINSDDLIEMFVTFVKQDGTYDNTQYKLWLMNENGSVIQDFGSAYYIKAGGYYSHNNETRASIYYMMREDNNYTTVVYRCAGPGQVSIPEVSQETITLGNTYPNPTTNTVTLPYHSSSNNTSEIHIYNTSGKLVQTVSVGPHFNEVLIDVSSFPSGLYIYECEGKTSKFVVK